MATAIRGKGIALNMSYDPKVHIEVGIETKTVPETTFRMTHVIIPPGKRELAHYHCNTEAGGYVIRGRVRIFTGPKHEQKTIDLEAGDFLYTPRGEIHSALNLSDTEPVEMVTTYPSVPSRELAGRTYVEAPTW